MTNRILKRFSEVDHVIGKAGREDTATDPAPLSMLETIIVLKPQSEWRKTDVWYSSWAPNWLLPVLRHITPDHISEPQLVAEMNQQLKIPGVSNSWTMPIRGRIDMLSTGIRTPLGLKIQGDDVKQIRNTPDAFLSGFCRIWPAACDEQSGVNIGQWGIGSKSEGFVAKLSLLPAHGRDRQESGRGLLILHA